MKIKLGSKIFCVELHSVTKKVEISPKKVGLVVTSKERVVYKTLNGEELAYLTNGKLRLAERCYFDRKKAEAELKFCVKEEILRLENTIKYHRDKLKALKSQLKGE